MVDIKYFAEKDFTDSLDSFFKDLNIPIDTLTKQSANPKDLIDTYNTINDAFSLIDLVYPYGIVNDAVFKGDDSLETIEDIKDFKKDYDGLLVFGVVLKQRENDLLPTRSQLTHITRSLNRSFPYTPITVVFKYKDSKHEYIAFANGERSQYSCKWKEGEKIGKVSILRDVRINKTHAAHLRILDSLSIDINKVVDFKSLYEYWQKVFSTQTLTKQFYNDLSYWYFWAIENVTFPSEDKYSSQEEKIEHKSKNVIRLLTRLLFVWFLKQKNLVPKELFDIDYLSNNLLKDFNPHNISGLFEHKSLDSIYYKAILQNLFFATLNCPIQPISKEDTRQRGFRKNDNYGQHRDANFLMRYEKHFSNPEHFLELVNSKVPFLNGGLFDCLDEKTANPPKYIDGFSDNLISPHQLIVPDFLFFGDEKGRGLDLSKVLEDKSKKSVNVKGLIDILKSYYFTVEENTPYDQEVSLDPELLGKVFENLLASYNPETKSTARKQSGSFYTPREIVQYMVDESLIAYLKNNLGERIENEIRKILSYSDIELELSDEEKKDIISSLYNCKILDPACGSGAFPMGILQQIVHIIKVLDNENKYWYELVKKQASFESEEAFNSTEKEKEELLREIGHNFDLNINSADYSRKLYVIENSIYGVDIQPLAVQISKLRFFISLVIEQKSNQDASNNFNIRPLPNLEAKFVAANTLIGIDKKENQLELFETDELRKLQNELKTNRHKIFTSKSPKTKKERKEKDKELRKNLAELLESYGSLNSEEAKLLAGWDMFDQNTSSAFFDSEWMFGINNGFNIVIGNPPYLKEGRASKSIFESVKSSPYYQGKMDIWYMFACNGLDLLIDKGVLCFIATNNWVTNSGASILRNKIVNDAKIMQLNDFGNFMIFDSASIQTMVMLFERNTKEDNYTIDYRRLVGDTKLSDVVALLSKVKTKEVEYLTPVFNRSSFANKYITLSLNETILDKISKNKIKLNPDEIAQGIVFPQDFLNKKNQSILGNKFKIGDSVFALNPCDKDSMKLNEREKTLIKPLYNTEQILRYYSNINNINWLIYTDSSFKNPRSMDNYPNLKAHLDKFANIITSDNKPYGLHRSRDERFFKGEKVIALRKCVDRPLFSYSDFDCYLSATFYVIKTNRVDMKYLTGLLNSKLIQFWLKNKGKMQGLNYQLDKEPLIAIPIASPEKSKQSLIKNLVNKILEIKNKDINGDITSIELKIDHIVYKLYDLTYDEVFVIDPLTSITREEYELEID